MLSSSAVKHERVCPGGAGGRCGGPGLTKAYSSEGPHYGAPQQLINPLHHHHHNGTHLQHRRPQVLSQSALGGGGNRRAAAVDDSGGIRSGRRGNAPAGAQTYELSQDLADKRIEMLERRYGGDQARRAATTIQRAYRHYAMTKKFRAITATAKAPERRLSRRFQGDTSTSPGGARNGGTPVNGEAAMHFRDPEQFIRSEFDELNKNLSASIYGDGRTQQRPARSASLRDSTRPSTESPVAGDGAGINRSSSLEESDNAIFYHNQSIDSSVIANDNLVKVPSSSSNNGANINEGNGGTNLTVSVTNSSLCSQDSGLPSNTALDNSNSSPKDLKYFSSEDSGFGSHEGRGSGGLGTRRGNKGGKKLPPEVPRRSSSIKSSESGHSADSYMGSPLPPNSRYHWASPASPTFFTPPLYAGPDRVGVGRERSRSVERTVMRRCPDNGSLSSVQSSGSDSSLSQSASDRATPLSAHDNPDSLGELHIPTSPVWKRKNQMSTSELIYEDKRLSNISENSEDSCQSHSSDRLTYSQTAPSHNTRYPSYHAAQLPKVPEVLRKRQYRVGLNLFNKKPERGITYLINRYFLENSPVAVAKFLLTRKGLSKQMIGEYLGNLQNSFNMAVLEMFSQEIDLSGMQVDVALRKYQTNFRLPGEAQKIERLMQVFAQRYCQCNPDIIANLRDPETVFVLAFAIIMLNTDLHTASMKQEKRMKVEDFVKNLRGVDDGYDIEREMLEGMYHRIKSQEFRTGHDHVTQVMKVQQTMVEKRPNLALPHRRLVCYCRLYEVPDSTKKERAGLHQREVFLFNDLLVVTKIFSKKKNSVTYSFRQSFPLAGLSVVNKETPHYQYLIEIKQRVDNKLLIAFNARNEHDRSKFCEDLKESISEMDEMENLRIEGELEKSKASLRASRPTSTAENRDSGVADMEVISTGSDKSTLNTDGAASSGTLSAGTLKRTTLSNSLIDMHEAGL
ncbi:Sec7 domain [Trinorchestia longiramus]|nr:Sec7 domain [Trinorchestia longiramus]